MVRGRIPAKSSVPGSEMRSVAASSAGRSTTSTRTVLNVLPASAPSTENRHPGFPAASVSSSIGWPTVKTKRSRSTSAARVSIRTSRIAAPSEGPERSTRSRSLVARARRPGGTQARTTLEHPALSAAEAGRRSGRRPRCDAGARSRCPSSRPRSSAEPQVARRRSTAVLYAFMRAPHAVRAQ